MVYRFGLFEFDDEPGVLRRNDRAVPLEPQPARALALLLSLAGLVVTREELRTHLWGADTHVDFDRGIAYSVAQLRQALGDDADNPRFIQTLPRRGFSFIAPVTVIVRPDTSITQSPNAPTGPDATLTHSPNAPVVLPAIWRRIALGSTLLMVVTGVLLVVQSLAARRPITAVAVFDNESGNPSLDRAVHGISDAIVDRLTSLGPRRLGVVGNAAELRRPRAQRDLQAIENTTGATFVVLGQLQTKGDQLSLLLQLIRLDDDTHLWTRRIERPPGDSLAGLGEDAGREVEGAVRQFVLHERPAVP